MSSPLVKKPDRKVLAAALGGGIGPRRTMKPKRKLGPYYTISRDCTNERAERTERLVAVCGNKDTRVAASGARLASAPSSGLAKSTTTTSLDWSHEFCLVCEKPTKEMAYCSESCRQADYIKSSAINSGPTSPASARSSHGWLWSRGKLEEVLREFHMVPPGLPQSAHGHYTKPIDLYLLKKAVDARGGFEQVCKSQEWVAVSRELGYSGKIISSVPLSLKNAYVKWLQPFEENLRRISKGGDAKYAVHQQFEMDRAARWRRGKARMRRKIIGKKKTGERLFEPRNRHSKQELSRTGRPVPGRRAPAVER
ncbi:hypothetical protein QBC47DRAFT_399030 [Echria macrotheca]|uniref:ARID domain-containing protein n=1 Tax=Echria macrotheca TaxID=438768 RepID=A0AAJ0BHQ0_9PEZI|nr:hypothetical protein QBC47DRAFT_399030 [Echria macrotheca]